MAQLKSCARGSTLLRAAVLWVHNISNWLRCLAVLNLSDCSHFSTADWKYFESTLGISLSKMGTSHGEYYISKTMNLVFMANDGMTHVHEYIDKHKNNTA